MAPQGKRGLQSCTDYQPRQNIALPGGIVALRHWCYHTNQIWHVCNNNNNNNNTVILLDAIWNSVGVFKKRILKRNILLKTLREERSLQQPEDNVVTATLSFCVTFVQFFVKMVLNLPSLFLLLLLLFLLLFIFRQEKGFKTQTVPLLAF